MGIVNRSLLWTALVGIGFWPASSGADPLLTFGPDVPLFISATASVRRDDNIFLSSQDKQSDTLLMLTPGLDFHWTGGQAKLAISASEQFSRYSKNHDLNDELANIQGNFGVSGAYASLSAAGSFEQEDQSSLGVQSSDEAVKHAVGSAALNGEFTVAPKTVIGLGGDFSRTTYPEVGFIATNTWTFPVNVFYAITPKSDLSLGYTYGLTRLDTGTGDSDSKFYNVGARGQFTPKLSGHIQVGVTESELDIGVRNRNLGLDASLDYAFSPNTTFSLNATSGFSTSPLGTSEKVETVGLTGRTMLSQSWTVSLSGNYEATDYLTAIGRRDGFWVADMGVSYIWTSTTDLKLDYAFRRNNSTLDAATFDDNVLTLSAASRF
jgi:hypothetical protein